MATEKRLIDANALLEDCGEEPYMWFDDCDREVQEHSDWLKYTEMIKRQPTIEAVEVVHARWRWGYNSMNQYGAWCAECECGWEDKGKDDDFIRVQGLVIAHKYCPNCGAKMDGDKDSNLLFADMEEIIDATD